MQSELIGSRARAKQLLAFDDLSWGKIRPTDIDLSLDFGGKVFVFGELKSGSATLTTGQRIHLQGLVRGLRKGGLIANAFRANHNTPNNEHDVHVAEAVVQSVYEGEIWERPPHGMTVLDFMNDIHDRHVRPSRRLTKGK